MKDKQKSKIKTLIISLSVFCVLYIIYAVRPLGTELHLSPEWTEDISRVKETDPDDILIPYRLGYNIGYFTPDGKIASNRKFNFQASIDKDFWAIYQNNNTSCDIYDKSDNLLFTLKESGFPFFEEDRIFLFFPGGTSFARYDMQGNKLWQYEGYSPITAFASSKALTVAGLADGTIVSINNDGIIEQQFSPGGSETEIIMGIAVSADGQLIAAVTGQNHQRVIVAQKNGEHSKIIFHEYLDADFKEQVAVSFNKKCDTVYFNYKGGLGIIDLVKLKSSHIPIEGIISQIEESDNPNLVFVLSHDGNNYQITAIEPFDNNAGSFNFEAENSFIQIYKDALFIGRNNKISRISISRR